MTIIQVKGLSKSFGEREVFKDISFEIRRGDKIGLVGWNGCGKTTLIKIIMGLLEAERGSVTLTPGVKIGYLPQVTEYTPLIEQEWMEEGKNLLHTASMLGLSELEHWDSGRLMHLSGGERTKLILSQIWAQSPGFLILDEPTNHLDMQGLIWLAEEINHFQGASLIISHDRYFLDQTANFIFEMEDGTLTIYKGNYSDYKVKKEQERQQQTREYDKQQQKIKMIEEQVAVLKQWSQKAHREAGKGGSNAENRQMGLREFERAKAKKKDKQLKSKLKRLDLELSKAEVEKPKEDLSVEFQFESTAKRGKRILEAKGLTKEFNGNVLFSKSHFYVKHGEKVGLIGPNGSGKTTFIKMLLENEPISKGDLWKSGSLKTAYLSQEVADLPMDRTVEEYFDFENWNQMTKARTIFANMGMRNDILLQPIQTLSHGEKTRMKLVKMIMDETDILILDEPTNHLDLPSREQLESTLSQYSGTLIMITHDRYMLEKLCDKLLVIEKKRIARIESGFKDYEERKLKNDVLKDRQKEKKLRAEERAVREMTITRLLGEISLMQPGTEEYQKLDTQLNRLMKENIIQAQADDNAN